MAQGQPQPAWNVLLGALHAPATPDTIRFLNAWHQAEGGSASFNPFNTTQPAAGASNYNSVGVKNYPSADAGVSATAATLRNGRYGHLLSDLMGGHASAGQLAQDVAQSPWGTGSGVLRVLGSSAPSAARPPSSALRPPAPSPAAGASGLPNLLGNVIGQTRESLGLGPSSLTSLLSAPRQPWQAPLVTAKAPAAKTQAAVNLTREFLGTPYKWGGSKPGGFDCSGLLQYVWAKQGVNIPRTTYDQWKAGKAVQPDQLQPGDAIFFKGSDAKGDLPGHVGMYLGNGRMVEAPHTGATVRISSIARKDYVGARRYA